MHGSGEDRDVSAYRGRGRFSRRVTNPALNFYFSSGNVRTPWRRFHIYKFTSLIQTSISASQSWSCHDFHFEMMTLRADRGRISRQVTNPALNFYFSSGSGQNKPWLLSWLFKFPCYRESSENMSRVLRTLKVRQVIVGIFAVLATAYFFINSDAKAIVRKMFRKRMEALFWL